MSNSVEIPRPSKADTAHSVVKAGLSSIPLIGASAGELMNCIIQPPLERRRNEWMESVEKRLMELGVKSEYHQLDSLTHNDSFVDTFLYASQVAMRTSSVDKLESLKNAVLNAALPISPEDAKQQVFLSLVDNFTPWHLRILSFLNSPCDWFNSRSDLSTPDWCDPNTYSSLEFGEKTTTTLKMLESAFSDSLPERSVLSVIDRNLRDLNLLRTEYVDYSFRFLLDDDKEDEKYFFFNSRLDYSEAGEKHTTDFGDQFLAFISPPK